MSLTQHEQKILKSIHITSENDPRRPEFPPDHPRFPATPVYRIKVPGFSNVWLKDESVNPTGTHKDRMAWEIVVTYHYFLLAKQQGQIKGKLPAMSLISSGNAALAIQTALRKHQLPNLKVLVDKHTDKAILAVLKKIGCEIHITDLSAQVLFTADILKLTDNVNGFDITSSIGLDPTTRFYDWLSYEIINTSPEYCFIPFGTGNLYENILNVGKKEITAIDHDPRFQGKVATLRNCHFIGVTTNDKKSKADKLYSPHLPFAGFNEQWISLYRQCGFCGNKSDVFVFREEYLNKAMDIAHDQGITCEPSGISGLAMLLQLRHQVPVKAKILIINTGKGKF